MTTKLISEKAPPDPKIEKWIEDNKQRFIDKYGDKGEEILYATAWKRYNTVNEQTIPRSEMPQVASEHLQDLLKYLKDKGVDYYQEVVQASSLKPVQMINHEAVKDLMNKVNNKQKPILVDCHFKIIDGHHRWAALSSLNKQALVFRLTKEFDEVVELIKTYKNTFYQDDINNIVEAKETKQSEDKDDKANKKKVKNVVQINPSFSDLFNEDVVDLKKKAKKAYREGNMTLCYEMIDKIIQSVKKP